MELPIITEYEGIYKTSSKIYSFLCYNLFMYMLNQYHLNFMNLSLLWQLFKIYI